MLVKANDRNKTNDDCDLEFHIYSQFLRRFVFVLENFINLAHKTSGNGKEMAFLAKPLANLKREVAQLTNANSSPVAKMKHMLNSFRIIKHIMKLISQYYERKGCPAGIALLARIFVSLGCITPNQTPAMRAGDLTAFAKAVEAALLLIMHDLTIKLKQAGSAPFKQSTICEAQKNDRIESIKNCLYQYATATKQHFNYSKELAIDILKDLISFILRQTNILFEYVGKKIERCNDFYRSFSLHDSPCQMQRLLSEAFNQACETEVNQLSIAAGIICFQKVGTSLTQRML